MILQALVALAKNESLVADPDFEFKPVAWIVRLKADGTLITIETLSDQRASWGKDKSGVSKPRSDSFKLEIPKQFYRSGVQAPPFFLVDNAKYIFGRVTGNAEFDAEEGAEKSRAFRELAGKCAAAVRSSDLAAVIAFFDKYPPDSLELALPTTVRSNDLFAFKVETASLFVHQDPLVRNYWKQLRKQAVPTGASRFRCLITGAVIGIVGPFNEVANPAPGKPIKIVSFNKDSFRSFGLKDNENAAAARAPAEAAARALSRLISRDPCDGQGNGLPIRHIRLSSDTVVVFWSPEPVLEAQSILDMLPSLLDGNPGAIPGDPTNVGNLLVAYRTGIFSPLVEPAKFCAMTVTGTKGRVIVRDWFESTVSNIQNSVARYIGDLSLGHRQRKSEPVDRSCWHISRPPTFRSIKAAMSIKAPKGKQKPKPDKSSAALILEFWRIASNPAFRVKTSIATKTMLRIKAAVNKGEKIPSAAYSILRLSLVRNGDASMTIALNKLHPDPAYHCGRLMAAVAEVQRWARRGEKDSSDDVTIIRRFFGAAMVSPGLYFGRLLAMAEKAHLPKIPLRRATFLRDTIGGILNSVPSSLPTSLPLKQQSLFTLGFYHQQSLFRGLPLFKYMSPTKQGDWVCSAGEQVVADALTELGHRWWHETTLNVERETADRVIQGWRSPDFLVLSSDPSSRRFIEVLGMMEREDYRETWRKKLVEYAMIGILPAGAEGESPNGRLYWINTSPYDATAEDAPSFLDASGRIDRLRVKQSLAAWIGDKIIPLSQAATNDVE